MKALLLETSTEQGLLAIIEDACVVEEVMLPYGLQNSSSLIPELDVLLEKHHLCPKDFGYFIAGTGPGSYTGIRVAVTVAKTLSYVTQKPLIGVTSLKAFVPKTTGPFAILLDARIGGVYLLTGNVENGSISYDVPQVCPLDQLSKILDPKAVCVTPHVERLKSKLDLDWELSMPTAHKMAEEALKDQGSKDHKLNILYLRKTQAEIENSQTIY